MSDTTQKTVELLIRARDVGSKAALSDISGAVGQLTAKLNEQAAAAAKGDATAGELRGTLRQLEEAGNALIRQQGLVDYYSRVSGQLDKAKEKAAAARKAFDDLSGSIEGEPTKKQQTQLASRSKSAESADARVAVLTDSLAKQAELLKAVGIPTESLATAQREILATATAAGQGIKALTEALENYEANLRRAKAAADDLKAAEQVRQQGVAAQKQVNDAAYVQAFTGLLDARDAAERRAKDAAEADAKALAELEEEERQAAAATEAFTQQLEENRAAFQRATRENQYAAMFDEIAAKERKAAEDRALQDKLERDMATMRRAADQAIATAKNYRTLATATLGSAAGPSSPVSDAVRAVLDPDAVARSTSAGARGQIDSIAAGLDAGEKSVERYSRDLANLSAAQRELVKNAGLIDSFQGQEAAAIAAGEAFNRAEAEVARIAAAARTTTAPTEELAASLKAAEAQAAAAGREFVSQTTTLSRLRTQLEAAGIDASHLAAEEKAIVAAAEAASGASAKLRAVMHETGGKSGTPGFLGLRPYEMHNLEYQINDVITQLGSGTRLSQVFAQQGGQILQIWPKAMDAIMRFIPYLLIIAPAAITAFAAVSRVFENDAAIRKFSSELRGSADSAQYSAQELLKVQRQVQQFGASFEDAGQAVQTFVEHGINPARMVQFGKAAQDLADVYGVKLSEAASSVAEGFSRGMDAIDKLDEKYDFLSAAQREQIKNLFEEGKAAEARSRAWDIFTAKQDAAASKARGPWAQAIRDLKNAWTEFLDFIANSAISKAAAAMIDAFANGLSVLSRRAQGLNPYTPESAKKALPGLYAQRDALKAAGPSSALSDAMASGYAAAAGSTPGLTLEGVQQQINLAEAAVRAESTALSGNTAAKQANGKATDTIVQGSERQVKAGAKVLDQLHDEIEARKDLRNREPGYDQHAIKQAGTNAAQRVLDAGGTDDQAKQARLMAEQDTGRRLKEERDRQAETDARRAQAEAKRKLDAEQGLANELASINAQVDKQNTESLAARLRAVDETYAKIGGKIKDAQLVGVTSVNGMSMDQFKAQVAAAEQAAKQLATQKFYTDAIKQAEQARSDQYRVVNDQLTSGAMTAQKGYEAIEASNAKLNPRIQQLAKDAIAFGDGLRTATPNPKLESFLAQMQLALHQAGGSTAAGGAGAKENLDFVSAAFAKINDLVKERTDLVSSETDLEKVGLETRTSAEAKIAEAYNRTTPLIRQQVDALQAVLDKMLAAGEITPTLYDTWAAKLKLVRDQTNYLSADAQKVNVAVENAVSSGMTQAFDSAAQDITDLIDGTQKLGDAWKDIGSIVGNFFASFLKSIATAIIQIEAMRIASSMFGGSGSGGGLGGMLFGGGADVIGSGSTNAITNGMSAGQQALVGAADSTSTAAASSGWLGSAWGWLTSLFHEGGVVGASGSGMRRAVNPAWFANAPRYHTGGVVGLSSNEQAAVLKNGEEVLTTDDPRNVLNGGKKAASGPSQVTLRNVLVQDMRDIPAAMAGSDGETVTIQHIKRNAQAVRQILGVKG